MPWLSIIMAVLSFLSSLKKNPGDKGKAVAVGALAGLGTYYVSHETEWGKDTLGSLDGVIPKEPINPGDATTTLPDGSKIPTTTTATPSPIDGRTTGVWDTIKGLGPSGVAGVIGAGAIATGAVDWKKLLPWVIGGVILWKAL